MVKYYGRARQRIGSVNTNQIGLKMSGCPSKVGRQGYLSRYIGRRAQCNQKFCGPVFYHGVLWKWNSGRCVAKAPRGQSFNSGVGHKNTPRFACGNTCEAGLDAEAAVKILNKYFVNSEGSVILVGRTEDLQSDLPNDVLTTLQSSGSVSPIKHYEPGKPEYEALPVTIKNAVDVINGLGIKAPLKKGGRPRTHIVGWATYVDQVALMENGYGLGNWRKFGPKSFLRQYSTSSNVSCDVAALCGGFVALCLVGTVATIVASDGLATALASEEFQACTAFTLSPATCSLGALAACITTALME